MARPSLEHVAEIQWPGGKGANNKLESTQERIGRKLLGASAIVAGVAVRGDLGWRKLGNFKYGLEEGEEDHNQSISGWKKAIREVNKDDWLAEGSRPCAVVTAFSS